MNYLLLLAASIASAGATVLLRRAGTLPAGQIVFGLPAPWLLIGLALGSYGLGFLAYAKALQNLAANVAYPVMTGLTLIFTLAVSMLWLDEALTLRGTAGAALLLVGIVLIGGR